MDVRALYALRFEQTGLEKRKRVWKVLCESYFSKLIPRDATVLDIACGYGEFINNIRAARKYAIDLNEDSTKWLSPDIHFVNGRADTLEGIDSGIIDVAFTSNFLEHFREKAELDQMLLAVKRVLKPGGKFIVMGPNIHYAYREYWDYYDHHLALSHISLSEALHLAGFDIVDVKDRFLPYTMNNGAPTADFVIKTYLKLPIAWKLFGKQFLVVARKPA